MVNQRVIYPLFHAQYITAPAAGEMSTVPGGNGSGDEGNLITEGVRYVYSVLHLR